MRHKLCPQCAAASVEGFPGRVRVVRAHGLCSGCDSLRKLKRGMDDPLWYRWAWGGKAAKFRPRVRRRRPRK